MYDKRVIRGSNFSHIHMQTWNPYFAYAGLLSGKGDIDASTKIAEAERRQMLRKRYSNRGKRSTIGTPPPVKGRRHEIIQTDRYLEELFVKPTEYNVECQTDLFLYEISEAPYIPAKNGIDVSTGIDSNDLFDSESDIEPILNALVEMTMTQAIHEFLCEEEFAALEKEKQQFLTLKKIQMVELKRLDQDQDTQTNRKIQLDSRTNRETNAAKLLHYYVSKILPEVLGSLDDEIVKKNISGVEENIQPWLAKEIASEVGQMIDSRELLKKLIREIVETRGENFLQQNENLFNA